MGLVDRLQAGTDFGVGQQAKVDGLVQRECRGAHRRGWRRRLHVEGEGLAWARVDATALSSPCAAMGMPGRRMEDMPCVRGASHPIVCRREGRAVGKCLTAAEPHQEGRKRPRWVQAVRAEHARGERNIGRNLLRGMSRCGGRSPARWTRSAIGVKSAGSSGGKERRYIWGRRTRQDYSCARSPVLVGEESDTAFQPWLPSIGLRMGHTIPDDLERAVKERPSNGIVRFPTNST